MTGIAKGHNEEIRDAARTILIACLEELENPEPARLLGYDTSMFVCVPKYLLFALKDALEALEEEDPEESPLETVIVEIVHTIAALEDTSGRLREQTREDLKTLFRHFADLLKGKNTP